MNNFPPVEVLLPRRTGAVAVLLSVYAPDQPPRKATTASATATESPPEKSPKCLPSVSRLPKVALIPRSRSKKSSALLLPANQASWPPHAEPPKQAVTKKLSDKLTKIDRDDVDRKEVDQEIDFLTTFCNVHRALSGQGTLATVQKEVRSFLSTHSKSYRIPEAIELLGNVLLASKDYEGARAQYTKLGKAPAPYFKARSAMLTGRSLQAEEKHQEAVAAFDLALQAAEGNAVAQSQVLEATLHRAVSQAALGNLGPSTDAVKAIITQADTQDAHLLAQAYNALGDCHLQANQKKEARQAFLHVDLLFSSAAAEHAKALHELSQLWKELGQPTRARDAQDRLKEKYPGSRWGKR